MPYQQLQDMLFAYGLTIGGPYRGWDMTDVLRVFAHFASTPKTWQKQVCDATGVTASKVNRLIDVAEEKHWVERPKSRTSDARKPLRLTTKGRRVIAEFERLCREAGGAKSRTATPEMTDEATPGTRLARAKGRARPNRGLTFEFEKYEREQPATKHEPR